MADRSFPPIIATEGYLMAKTESTYGVDPTCAPAVDPLLVYDVALTPNCNILAQRYFTAWAGSQVSVVGAALYDVAFKIPLVGNGLLAGNVVTPSWHSIMLACQWSAANLGTPTVTYTPITQQVSGCSLEFIFYAADVDGNAYNLRGFMGQTTLVFNSQETIAYIEVAGKALYTIPVEATGIVAPTYDELTPPDTIGITATIDGDDFVLPEFSVVNGTEIAEGKSMSSTAVAGYRYTLARRTTVTGSFKTDAKRENTGAGEYDWYAARDAGREMAVVLGVIGATGGNRFQLTGAKMCLQGIKLGADGPVQMYECETCFHWTNGNDEVSLIVT
ncbi:MAG: hypothetical protein KJ578_15805 [Bacteroidetes bacterium]|nr:hypothetical protein [Bacteroidota bacterium]